MTVRDIVLYPDARLRAPAQTVSAEAVASDEIQSLLTDMVDTMYHHPGAVGLAAPQVGAPWRIFVMDATAKTTRDRLYVFINPVITQQSQWKFGREGCLSFPDYLVTVKRARKLEATWDEPSAESKTEAFREFEAIIFQHELDHLDGVLFLDRVQNLQTDLIRRNAQPSGEPATAESSAS